MLINVRAVLGHKKGQQELFFLILYQEITFTLKFINFYKKVCFEELDPQHENVLAVIVCPFHLSNFVCRFPLQSRRKKSMIVPFWKLNQQLRPAWQRHQSWKHLSEGEDDSSARVNGSW